MILIRICKTLLCGQQKRMVSQKLTCHVNFVLVVAIDLKQKFIDLKIANAAIQIKNSNCIKLHE